MKKAALLITLIWAVKTTNAQNVGIGISNPTHALLEVNGSVGTTVAMFGSDKYGLSVEADYPVIGLNHFYNNGAKTIKAGFASYFGMNPFNGDFYFATFNGNQSSADFGPITGDREALKIKQNGYVGIATDPAYPLTIKGTASGGGIVQESPDGTAQVGFYTNPFTAYLQTWTNTPLNFATGNGVSRMVLNTNGSLTINKSLNLGVGVYSIATGSANLLPIAFGSVSEAGNVIFSAGNIAVTHPSAGQYQLTITGEDIAANSNKYTLMLTPRSSNENFNPFARNWINYTIQGGVININTGVMAVNAQQITSCGCGASYINSGNPALAFDCAFDITIYKNN
jgi:hypothetical protein